MATDERRSAPTLKAVGNGKESAAQQALALALTLEEISAVLAPILGPVAVAALYRRCLHLCSVAHAGFEPLQGQDEAGASIASIQALLAHLTSAEARQMSETFIETFYSLMASLIGSTLTEQLVGDCTAGFMHRIDHQSSET